MQINGFGLLKMARILDCFLVGQTIQNEGKNGSQNGTEWQSKGSKSMSEKANENIENIVKKKGGKRGLVRSAPTEWGGPAATAHLGTAPVHLNFGQ